MGQDYYDILDVTSNASIEQINKAYRFLSLRYHPNKNPTSDCAWDQFFLVSEAFEVLSDPEKRGIYDRFGEEGLKTGVPLNDANKESWSEPYIYHGNPMMTFTEFFGSNSPFQKFVDQLDDDLNINFGGLEGRGKRSQDPDIQRNLMVTLEDTFYGCLKKMRISKRILNEDGRSTRVSEKILTIRVQKGWLEGTKIRFSEEGDQGPNNIPADLVFILKHPSHPRFVRRGHNLVYTTKIPLGKALVNCIVNIDTLDGRKLHIPVTEIVHPEYIMKVSGEGMPIPGTQNERGDLLIKFSTDYPSYLLPNQKELIDTGFFRTH